MNEVDDFFPKEKIYIGFRSCENSGPYSSKSAITFQKLMQDIYENTKE